MTRYETAIEEIVTQGELTGLAKATGPCVSAAANIPDPAHLRPEMHKLTRNLEKCLKDARLDAAAEKTLLEPLRDFAGSIEAGRDWAVTLAIYRSADIFHCFRVPQTTKEFILVGDTFDLRPLLPVVSREQRFYLLALSQNKVRLFDCSHHRIQEIELAGRVPENLRAFVNARMPDHVLDNRATAGMSSGVTKGIMFGTTTEREKRDEYLTHFFKEIDRALHKLLSDSVVPLLLAGVEYELAIYRKISTYPHVMESQVHGSPDGLSPSELHDRAREAAGNSFSASLGKLMHEFPRYRDDKRVVFDLTQMIAAGYKGRISHILLREGVEGRKMSLAVRQTLIHGGEAYMLKDSEMPDHADVAAVIRY